MPWVGMTMDRKAAARRRRDAAPCSKCGRNAGEPKHLTADGYACIECLLSLRKDPDE